MSTTLAKTYLANYEALITKKMGLTPMGVTENKNSLKALFTKAKMVQFIDVKSKLKNTEQEKNLCLYLGLINNQLQAILVKESDAKNNLAFEEGKFATASFLSEVPVFKVTGNSTNSNKISETEYKTRLNNWNSKITEWVDAEYKTQTLVKFFIIPTANFNLSGITNLVFGYKSENVEGKSTPMIDLMSVTEDAFADLIKPVPPFKPGW